MVTLTTSLVQTHLGTMVGEFGKGPGNRGREIAKILKSHFSTHFVTFDLDGDLEHKFAADPPGDCYG